MSVNQSENFSILKNVNYRQQRENTKQREYTVIYIITMQANTDVLVGIKAELGEPAPDRPTEGRLEFFVDW